jgi:hypothetical protein
VPHSSTDHRRAAGRIRRLLATVLSLAVPVTAGLAGATVAFAHGDEGVMEVISAEAPSPSEVAVEVGVVYANDDDLAEEATVTVVATGPDGSSVGPVDVPRREDAVYAATFAVPSPGSWSLEFTSTGPAATATTQVTVPDAPATTSPPTTDPPTSDASSSEPPETTAASDDEQAAGTTDDEDGTNVLPLVVIALVVLAVGTALVLVARSRGARATETGA